jgi:hypothetical protein
MISFAWLKPRFMNAAIFSTLAAIVLGIVPTPSPAVSPESWKISSYADYAGGETERVTIRNPGEVALSPSYTLYSKVGESAIWSLVESSDGSTLYLGTGNRARIYTVTTEVESTTADAKLFADLDGNVVQAMAFGPDGQLYAAVSPGGNVYKISEEGAVTLVGEAGQPYIWAMAFESKPEGDQARLILATGDKGLIVAMGMDGKTETLLETEEKHILSMIESPEGTLYFGTAPNGWVGQIDAEKDFRVLYDSSLSEVKALALDEEGNLFAGIVPAQKVAPKPDNPQAAQASEAQDKDSKNSELVRISPEGLALALLTTDNAAINTLYPEDAGLLLGTGDKGILYRLGYRNQADLILQLPPSDLLTLSSRKQGGIWITSANPANLYAVPMGTQKGGLYAAKPLDAGVPAVWGNLSYIAEVPEGATFDLQTRSGNTEKPDDNWSDWSEPIDEDGKVQSPAGRYLQWRARFGGNDSGATAVLKEVEIIYQKMNLPPEITQVKVGDRTSSSGNGSSSSSSSSNGSSKSTSSTSTKSTSTDSAKSDKVELSWQAKDANGDSLVYDLSYRRIGEGLWKEIEDDLDSTKHEWKQIGLPDGDYELRLVASDRSANPPASAQQDEWITEPVKIDNNAPLFGEWTAPKVENGVFSVSIQVRDSHSRLVSAHVIIDGEEEEKIALLPMDEILDAKVEDFSVILEDLESGEHSAMLRVQDEAGNIGASAIVFTIP